MPGPHFLESPFSATYGMVKQRVEVEVDGIDQETATGLKSGTSVELVRDSNRLWFQVETGLRSFLACASCSPEETERSQRNLPLQHIVPLFSIPGTSFCMVTALECQLQRSYLRKGEGPVRIPWCSFVTGSWKGLSRSGPCPERITRPSRQNLWQREINQTG